jgi:hypothetical protein
MKYFLCCNGFAVKNGEVGGACSTNGGRGMHIGYWWGIQKERDHWEDQDVGGWIILKWILERWDGMVWVGLMWLRMGTSGGFHKMLGSS